MSNRPRMEIKIQPTSNNARDVEEKGTPWIVRTMFVIILTFVKWTGLVPFSLNLETKSVNFKLVSWRTLFAFLRLVIFTFPFAILPFIFYACGFVEQEAFDLVEANSDNATTASFVHSTSGKVVMWIGYYVNFLAFVLPFAFAYFVTKPLESLYRIRTAEHNSALEKSESAAKGAFFPLFGFGLFFIGKLIHVIAYLRWFINLEGFSKFYFYTYSYLCTQLFIDFPLHFLLATYEYFFYRNMPTYESLAKRVLKTEDSRQLLERTKELTVFMENTQNGYGFFLFVDLSLMLLFWLIHTFRAYFSFQVIPGSL